nr:MAG TPA: hypothetical protein [Caudoviricetes sp.]DAM96683.1 MAG TPA: hypothetical protein [Bacteriophage sp.]DAO05112.1 MAG TPA: hypothetical protein [Bacteriophage sp.]DAQ34698.1 MAG TPA: hypothetical protein [Caudoviricetes sp.]DAY96861.1 MAG TPA: hypothetical protein [Caudoviricetes sp.]
MYLSATSSQVNICAKISLLSVNNTCIYLGLVI